MDLRDRKKPSFFKKISLWWNFEGQYYVKDFKKGISNIIKWFPIIWKDRDYDYKYIYDLLEFKLRDQAKGIGRRDRHTRAARDSQKMLLCVNLIAKLKEGDYSIEYADYHKTKFEFLPIKDSEYFELDTTELEENFQDYFDKYPLIYKKVTSVDKFFFPNDSKMHIAMNIGHENERRAKRLLYKILEQDLEGFWD